MEPRFGFKVFFVCVWFVFFFSQRTRSSTEFVLTLEQLIYGGSCSRELSESITEETMTIFVCILWAVITASDWWKN